MINPTYIALHSLHLTYLAAVLLVWLLSHYFGEFSGVPRKLRTKVIYLPMITSIFKGLLPGLILMIILAASTGYVGFWITVPERIGSIFSGILLHKRMRSSTRSKQPLDIKIFLLTASLTFLWALSLLEMGS